MIKIEKLNNNEKEANRFKSELQDLLYVAKNTDERSEKQLWSIIKDLSERFINRSTDSKGTTIDPLSFKPVKKFMVSLDLEKLQDNISMNGLEKTAAMLGINLINEVRML